MTTDTETSAVSQPFQRVGWVEHFAKPIIGVT
jgi:hypothetical protein